jgi:hypothetical protein
MAAPRCRDLLGGVVVGVLPFVLLVVVVGWRCYGVCSWYVLLSGCRGIHGARRFELSCKVQW